jgi:hypothetical protein
MKTDKTMQQAAKVLRALGKPKLARAAVRVLGTEKLETRAQKAYDQNALRDAVDALARLIVGEANAIRLLQKVAKKGVMKEPFKTAKPDSAYTYHDMLDLYTSLHNAMFGPAMRVLDKLKP